MGAGAAGLERLVKNTDYGLLCISGGRCTGPNFQGFLRPSSHTLFHLSISTHDSKLSSSIRTSELAPTPYCHQWNKLQETRSSPAIRTWPYSVHRTRKTFNKRRQHSKADLENQLKRKVLGTNGSFLSQLLTGKEGPWDHNAPTGSFSAQWTINSLPQTTAGAPTLWRWASFSFWSLTGIAHPTPRASSLSLGDAECS